MSETEKECAVSGVIEAVANDICDNYCKYPGIYGIEQGGNEADVRLNEEKCEHCPLNRLL